MQEPFKVALIVVVIEVRH